MICLLGRSESLMRWWWRQGIESGCIGKRGSIVADLQGFCRARESFNWLMEDLGEWGYKRLQLLISKIDCD